MTNADRFSGFSDLYDANRPSAPRSIGPVLRSYANAAKPVVVDLGSGTGLSTRWAATWAKSVVGIEPSDDMRRVAELRPRSDLRYLLGTAERTGLPDACADIVVAVQAMHWMEPTSTITEVKRILRPGGVFAVIDADWPPVSCNSDAELAWVVLHKRIRVFEARAARGEELRAPITDDDPALDDEDLRDTHRNRAMPDGVRSWSKSEHLQRLEPHFRYSRELVFDGPHPGNPESFIALMKSQGSYQGLLRHGLSEAELGATDFEQSVRTASAERPLQLSFSWRVRLGVT